MRRYRETGSETIKAEYETFMRITPCSTCKGMRLKRESLAVTVADKNIYEVTNLSIRDLASFLSDLELTKTQQLIGEQILKEIRARVQFLIDVGLDYLCLSRATGTLSGGEAQRIVSSSCSTTITELPRSRRCFNVPSSLSLSL